MNGQNNTLILAIALVAAAIILAVGLNYSTLFSGENNAPQNNIVQLPGYLTQSSYSTSEYPMPAVEDGTISFAADETGAETRLIDVSGTVTKKASPDEATITFSVETRDKSAAKSQSDNATIAQGVIDALKQAGVADSDIKTVSYSLYEDFQWNDMTRKSESVGYRTTNSIQATVRDLSQTGPVIDAGVQAGANNVSGVSFQLSDAKEAELKMLALKEAAENAKVKAQSIASGLGISVGQVYSASESSNYVIPYYSYDMVKASAGEGASSPTPVIAGDVQYSATVSVQFEII